MIKERISEEQIEQARRADVLALVENRVELKRESRGEFAGPCPRCGGMDRFHVTAEWFMCRQCHERRGDAIELLRWLTPGLGFAEAVAQLAGGAAPAATHRGPAAPRPAAKPPAAQPAEWQRRVSRIVALAQEALLEPEGEAGAEYLLSRGLEPRTWLAYGLGFRADAPVPGTQGQLRSPAIVLPWQSRAGLVAVRYRFLQAQDGHKLTAEQSSQFAGKLFGGQALPDWAVWPVGEGANLQRLCTLLIVEGEINAMSAWQVAADTGLHVLSLGSESAGLSEAAVQFAQRYGLVLAWADKGKIAQRLMAQLPGAAGLQSPGGEDANDLHRRGLLGGLLARKRETEARAKGAEELEALLWALYDAALLPAGIDGGTAEVLQRLARQLGKQAAIYEAEPGRWITVSQPVAALPVAAHARAEDGRPPLPEQLWRHGLSTFAEARAVQVALRGEYVTALGFDRERAAYYVTAPCGEVAERE